MRGTVIDGVSLLTSFCDISLGHSSSMISLCVVIRMPSNTFITCRGGGGGVGGGGRGEGEGGGGGGVGGRRGGGGGG